MDPWASFVASLPRIKKPARLNPIRLVCFDLDGVLTQQASSWVYIHRTFGARNGPGFEAFVRGEIDDEEFIRQDVGFWLDKRPGMTIHDVERILDGLTLVPGARRTCERLRGEGCELAIVSGGIEYAARRFASRLGIDHVSANGLNTRSDGRLTGDGVVNTPLRNKALPIQALAKRLRIPLGAVAAIGNSATDIPMFRTAGLGIAFRAVDEHTSRAADVTVEGENLAAVLAPILGTR